MDAMKLPLPPLQGLNKEVLDSRIVPSYIAWSSSEDLALFLPSGVCNVVNAVSCEVLWTGLGMDLHGGGWDVRASGGDGGGTSSKSRRSSHHTPVHDTASIGSGVRVDSDVPSRRGSDGMGPRTTGSNDSAGTGIAPHVTPDNVHSFVVWSDTAVYECVSSSVGPASSCLQHCMGYLESERYPRPDLALRACSLAVGITPQTLSPTYHPYAPNATLPGTTTDPITTECMNAESVITSVPPAHMETIADLFVQCYAMCRSMFCWNPAVFSSSSACSMVLTRDSDGAGEGGSEKRHRPRRAAYAVIAGVDVHRFLMVRVLVLVLVVRV